MNEIMLPLWAEVAIAVLVLAGSLIALLGSWPAAAEVLFRARARPSIIATWAAGSSCGPW
jgi:multicomponent K+:H+ antiporter subunit G